MKAIALDTEMIALDTWMSVGGVGGTAAIVQDSEEIGIRDVRGVMGTVPGAEGVALGIVRGEDNPDDRTEKADLYLA
jgi:hypothetical protein